MKNVFKGHRFTRFQQKIKREYNPETIKGVLRNSTLACVL